jgi:hypothetical protein
MMIQNGEWPTSFYEECLERTDEDQRRGHRRNENGQACHVEEIKRREDVRIHTKKWIVFSYCIVRYFWFVNLFTDLIWNPSPQCNIMDLTAKVITHGMKRRPDQPKVEFVLQLNATYIWWSESRYTTSTNNTTGITATATHLDSYLVLRRTKIRTSQYLRKENEQVRLIPLTLTMIIRVKHIVSHTISNP